MKLVTTAQMRELERKAVLAGTSLDHLMEQAGLAVAQEAWLALGAVAERQIVVLVGPGNNGGDGLVAARHLAEWEANVVVYLLAPRVDDKRVTALQEVGVPMFLAADDPQFASLEQALQGADLVIDALLGTGRARRIGGELAEVLRRLRHAQERTKAPRVIAVDLPTGVDADSGSADELAVRADSTVTFGVAKAGLYAWPGPEYAGRVEVVDIGLPKDAERELPIDLLDTMWVRERLPLRRKDGNKGTFGRVLVVAGSTQYAGAPRLAAEACYRSGAGLVTIACPTNVQGMIAPSIAEATWLPLGDAAGMLDTDAADTVISTLHDYDVLLIGPGLGQGDGVRRVVKDVLRRAPPNVRGCVIDADALNALSAGDEPAPWHQSVSVDCVLTPHPGEMARLVRTTVGDVQDDRLAAAVESAREWGQTVVLKGAHTVIAAADGRVAISPHANPLLASAGTGDVLAGTIAGLLAQGCSTFEAAACAVFLHGLAAEELSEEFGDRGLLASDLLPAIPRAIRIVMRGRATGANELGFAGLARAFRAATDE